MAQVVMPQKKNEMAQMMPVVGAVAGGIIGGYASKSANGAMGGASAGAGLGSLAGGMMSSNTPAQATPQSQVAENPATSPNAISRRMDSMNTQPVEQLTAAQTALKYQPPDTQKQYMDTINQALILAQRDQRRGQA